MTLPVKPSNLFSVAVVGGASLKGREVRDMLGERNFPALDVKLLDDEEALGQLEQVNDELTFIQGVLPEHLEGVDFAFLAADQSFIEKVWTSVRSSGSEIIDLSYALENNTDVVLRAPWFEREVGRTREVELKSSPVVGDVRLQEAPRLAKGACAGSRCRSWRCCCGVCRRRSPWNSPQP